MDIQRAYSLAEIHLVAKDLLSHFPKNKIFCFEGNLGAGKTTLIEEICRVLGSRDDFSSPTFSIINEYTYKDSSIFHIDLYRLNSNEEILDIGLEDCLYSRNYCFIEWYQKAETIIPKPYIKVTIENLENEKRMLTTHTIYE